MDDLIDSSRRNADIVRQTILRNLERLQKILEQHFAGMNRQQFAACYRVTSVIVDDLDRMRVSIDPSKANTPLIIHANTVLAAAITSELLQPMDSDTRQITGFVRWP